MMTNHAQCHERMKHSHRCSLDQVEQQTVLQVRGWFQNEEPPSKLKSTPPSGAPKAAATPAAAPLDAKSLLYLQWFDAKLIAKQYVP